MCCTFGDLTDVNWWRELQLPTRVIIGRDGRIVGDKPEWIKNVGCLGRDCRKDDLRCAGVGGGARCALPVILTGSRQPTLRKASFYEKGDKPLEIVSTRQWYIRNGGRDEDLKRAMLQRGEELRMDSAAHEVPLRQLGERPQR